ncbi:MAG: cation-transporting P-type ATPase, partial [Candidatus Omnitrophica bacterium]|nr:cation-transporting P-type ATPase [Candidatus Omnitrophota bacterium]
MSQSQNSKNQKPVAFFSAALAEDLLKEFMTSWGGLSEEEASLRIERQGYNEPAKKKKRTVLWQILQKFWDPLIL